MSKVENTGAGGQATTPEPKSRRRIRGIHIVEITIVLIASYVLVFALGKPKPTVNYVALLNEMTKVEGRSEADNAWADYEKAFQLHVFDENDTFLQRERETSFHRFEDLNDVQRQAIETWIARSQEAWQTFGRAVNRPYYRKEYRYRVDSNESKSANVRSKSLLDTDGREAAASFRMMILGRWRIRVHLSQGHVQEALDDSVVLIKAGTQRNGMKPRAVLDSVANGYLCNAGYDGLIAVLRQGGPAEIDLAGLDGQLDSLRPHPESIADLTEWHLMNLDLIQHFFTSWGIGGGHLVMNWPWFDHGQIQLPGQGRAILAPVAFLHARRQATLRKHESMYQQLHRTLRLTPYQRKISGLAETYTPFVPENALDRFLPGRSFCRYMFIGMFVPATDRFVERAHEQRALHDAVVTVLAVKRYQADKGRYPETLEELVQTQYLTYLPPDPYSDESLVYRKTQGGFILYSVGWNMKDDGGKLLTRPDSSPMRWGSETDGDAVFWPQ